MFLKKISKIINVLRGVHVVDIDALKAAGLNIGNNCSIQDGVILDYNHIQHIFIGNNVTIAPQVYILAHDASTYKYLGYTKVGKVIIEDNVFIGARSIIMPGVKIGENSIVGAGSVVVNSIEANAVYAGTPAKFICRLENFLKRQNELLEQCPKFDERYTRRNEVSKLERQELNNEMNNLMGEGWGFIK